MYILKQEQGEGLFYVLNNKEYIVGRKNADILIIDDQSISRKHAIINTKGNTITVTDCKSKYGTFHNNVKIQENVDATLHHNDTIKFGVFQSSYKIENFPIITTGSGLNQEQKNDVKAKMANLGGSLVSTWHDSCTFLTANELILTIKVLLALIEDKPIVTPKFWEHFLTNVTAMKPLPNPADFKPPTTETLLNKVDLTYNPARRELFKEKVFVFGNDKLKKKMFPLISKTGGTSISWEKKELSLHDVTKSKNKYLFIFDEDKPTLPRSLNDIIQHVEKLGERPIPVQEIAMAVVLCSTEKDCNPKFNRVGNVFEACNLKSQTAAFSLGVNTPAEYEFEEPVVKTEALITGSLDQDMDLFINPVVANKKVVGTSGVSNQKDAFKHSRDEAASSEGTPSKRRRVEGTFTSSHKSSTGENTPLKRKQLEGFFTSTQNSTTNEDTSSKKRRLESFFTSTHNSTIPQNGTSQESLSKKRRADESLASTSKKPSLSETFTQKSNKRKSDEFCGFGKKKANPCALGLKRRDDAPNPFAAFRVKNEVDDNNPFVEVLKKPQIECLEPVQTFETTPVYSCSYASDTSDGTWLSASRIKNEKETDYTIELDPEFREVFERFKDTVVIEKMPVTAFRKVVPRFTPATPDTSVGKKNFKRFRKVQPQRPQTTILVTSFQQSNSRENSVGSDDHHDDDDDESEDEEVQPVRARPKSRFDF